MNRIKIVLKEDRTLHEMLLGIAAVNILLAIAAAMIPNRQQALAGVLTGTVIAFVYVIHMAVTMDDAMNLDEKGAVTQVRKQMLIRYLFVFVVGGSALYFKIAHTKGDNAFFLEFTPLGSRRISYASSFSVSQIDEPYYSQYTKYLLKYQYLSVRESSGKTLIKQMLGKDSSLVLDPTLLITSEQWIKFASSKIDRWFGKHYILVYLLNYAFHAEECVKDIVEKIRRNTGLDVIVISTKQTTIDSTKTIIDVGIEEFIHLFSNAEYVVTSSFHGTAFAINFGKRLVSVTNNKSLDDRQNSILRLLHLERCIATSADSVDIVNCETLCARSLLDELRSDSINYLKKTLS